MIQPKENTILIADPFLKDDNFIRSVIFLCSHNEEGSFGLVLNKLFDFTLNNLVSGIESLDIPVFVGGPVALDTIHFLHQYPDLVPDCQQLDENLAWGGDFETIKSLLISGEIDMHKIKFFIGYSGWSAGQLENEIEEKTWITSVVTRKIIFNVPTNEIWKQSVVNLGGDFEQMANYPIDPQLN